MGSSAQVVDHPCILTEAKTELMTTEASQLLRVV
jgi:hypothetical protein